MALVLAAVSSMGVSLPYLASLRSVYASGPLYTLETSTHDSLLRLRNPDLYSQTFRADPRSEIAIVAIDEKSIAELGIFRAWPRTYYAELVDRLMAGPSRVIVFDILFADPAANQDEDEQFSAKLAATKNRQPAVSIVISAAGGRFVTVDADGTPRFEAGLEPLPHLAGSSCVASADVIPDETGTIRSIPLIVRHGDLRRPSLSLAAAALYSGQGGDDSPFLCGAQRFLDQATLWTDSGVPQLLRINFLGPPSQPNSPRSTFTTVSFVDVLYGRVDPSLWRDRIVFVGLLGAIGAADDYWTPVSYMRGKMAGVEIAANGTATLLSGRPLWAPDVSTQFALVLSVTLAVALLNANLGLAVGTFASIALLVAYLLAAVFALDWKAVQVPLAPIGFSASIAFVGVILYRAGAAERQLRTFLQR